MNKLTVDQILPIEEFVARRPSLESQVLTAKENRRFTVGGHLTFLFENHLTMWWQVQEMCRVEGITRPEAVAHEVQTYGGMLPGPDSLSATLLIEYAVPEERDAALASLLGLQDHVRLELEGAGSAKAVFDEEQFNEARLSSVQFIRFPLSQAQREALGRLGSAAHLMVDHPAMPVREPLPGVLRAALVDDLQAAD